jgi:hypothetical protein
MYNYKLLFLIVIFIGMTSSLNEEIYRMKTMMGIVTENNTPSPILSEGKVSLPMKISGEYTVPNSAPNKGDALHSFNRRRSDGFGGYMLSGNPPSKWSQYIKFNQGKSINQALQEVWNSGVNPDITNLKIQVDSKSYTVRWSATIDESEDGNAYVGVSSVGSAGGGADSRAQGQVEGMKRWEPGAKDYTLVLDFKNPSGIYIRQFFYKYTKPNEFKPHDGGPFVKKKIKKNNDDDVDTNNSLSLDIEKFFKGWKPGEYKLKDDKMWTYRLTDDKEWEATKSGSDFVNLKSALSDENYKTALEILKDATKN